MDQAIAEQPPTGSSRHPLRLPKPSTTSRVRWSLPRLREGIEELREHIQ